MNTCSICRHRERGTIDRELLAGIPLRTIAGRTGTTKSALDRHRPHIAKAMVKAAETAEVALGAGLLKDVIAIRDRAAELGKRAEDEGDLRAALAACRELTRNVELMARLALEAQQGRAQDISSHPVWHKLRGELMEIVSGCPVCAARLRAAIAQRLGIVESEEAGGES